MADDEESTPGIAGHIANALVGAHGKLSDKLNAAKLAHTTDVLETFERDIAPLLAPAIEKVLANPGTPDHLRALLEQVGAPEHFSSSLLIGVAVGAIIAPVLGAATQPFVQGIENGAWVTNPSRPVSPDVWAASVLKGVRSEAQGSAGARLSGIDDAGFQIMVEASGNAIGFQEALLLERQGKLAGTTLDAVLQYSNVNPKFYAAAKNLIYTPPPPGAVLTGALKGHLAPADARARLAQAGIDPSNFDWMLAAEGRPISPLEGVTLWKRGELTEARLDEIIAQSDINPTFAPEVKKLGVYYPPPRSIVPMLRSGAITEARARELLAQHGLKPEDVDAFVKEAQHAATNHAKSLTQAQIVAVYEARLIDRATATARLEALTLPAGDVALLLDLADEKRTLALQNAGARAVGSKYVAHRLTKTEASNALGTLGVPTAAQHDLFTVWDVERGVATHTPNAAQIVHLYRQGNADPASTRQRMIELGIAPTDLAYFIAAGYPPTAKGGQEAAVAIFEIVG